MSENFLKEVFRHLSRTFPNQFLWCDGVSIVSGHRYCQLPSDTSKTLPALAKKRKTHRKSFGQAFSKACEVKGEQPLARSAEREIPLSAFLFDRFFFAPPSCKEKSAVECREQNESAVLWGRDFCQKTS
ncbi:MAG: hypothetical protein E7666_03445 [Ruminococcaceae bacterium]|nr:hypothetical protein [Oscillospiraceae bacterium]